jgi:hypothetical protein
MALDITHVQAGELITAALVNELIDELEKLDVRVTALETTGPTGGAVEIIAVTPQTLEVGDVITIVGKNFDFLNGGARVRFNGFGPKTFAEESNDTLIICEVPDLGVVLPAEGLTVQLAVSNTTTTASRTITVKPPKLEQVGGVNATFAGVSPDPIVANGTAELEFTLVGELSMPATITLTPRAVGQGGAPLGWATKILNAAKAQVPNRQIAIGPGETKAIYVALTIPPGTNSTPFTLELDISGDGIDDSGDASLTVGQTSKLDTSITKLSPLEPSGAGVTLANGILSVPRNGLATLPIEADFTVEGDYVVTFTQAGGTDGWTLAVVDPAVDEITGLHTKPVTQGDLDAGDGVANEGLTVRARPSANATSGHGILTVQRTDQDTKRVITFDLTPT